MRIHYRKFLFTFIFFILIYPASHAVSLTKIEKIVKDQTEQTQKYIIQFKDAPLSVVKQKEKAKLSKQNTETGFSKSNKTAINNLIKNKRTEYKSLRTRFRDKIKQRYQPDETGLSGKKTKKRFSNKIIRRDFYYLFNGVAAELTKDELDDIKTLPFIKKIFADKTISLNDTQSDALIHADYFRQQTSATGNSIVIAIIDTGVDYLHPDLGGGIGPGYKVIGGYDFINDDSDPMDDNGHGTHCAGIAAANGVLKGIAPDANILAYKVLNTAGNGIFSDIVAALEKAADPDNDALTDDHADVVSISLGGYGDPDDPLSLAVDNAVAEGMVCCISAGNERNYYSIGSPGCARDAITVGATNKDNTIAYYSSRGPTNKVFLPKPDILATGSDIYSTLPDGGYGYKSGTSMAAPHVSGASALLLEIHPTFEPNQIKNIFRQTATPLSYDALTQGSGLINLENVVDLSAIITPAVVYLGQVNDSIATWNESFSFDLKNIASARTFSLYWESDNITAGVSLTYPASVSLNLNESISIPVDVTIENSQLPALTDLPYSYHGYIVIEDTVTLKQYRLQVLFLKEKPDPFEPNNTFADSYNIPVTADRNLVQSDGRTKIDPQSGLASDPDNDWFSFYAEAGDRINLDINAIDIGSPLDSTLTLYDSSHLEIESSTMYGYHSDPFLRDVLIPSTGTYHIKIEGDNISDMGAYHLITSKMPDNILWYTDINSLKQLNLLAQGAYTLLTKSNGIELLDNINSGLQLWEITNLNPIKTGVSQSGNLIAVLSTDNSLTQLITYNTLSEIAQWQYTFAPDITPSDIAVSRDGSTIAVYSEDDLQKNIYIHIFNRLSSFPELVYTLESDELYNAGFSISSDGSIIVFSDAEKTYLLDKNLQTIRWSGKYQDRAYIINSDATYLAGSSTSYRFTLRKWNGQTYETLWHFNPGNGYKIFKSGISPNGEKIVVTQRFEAGFYGLEDNGLAFYFFDSSSNKPIYQYNLDKDNTVVPKDDLFGIRVPNAVEEINISDDANNIAITTWGGDPQQPEILFFNPDYQYPIGKFYSLGSVADSDLNDMYFAFFSQGKHNFHFFRFFIDQQLVSLNLNDFLSPVPPFIRNVEISPNIIQQGDTIAITANISDSSGISSSSVEIFYNDNDDIVQEYSLYDNGSAPDNTASDNIYTASFTTDISAGHDYYLIITAQDNDGNSSQTNDYHFSTNSNPRLALSTFSPDNDSALRPGTLSYINVSLFNSGQEPAYASQLTMAIQDPYVDDYYSQPIDIPAINDNDWFTVTSNLIYIKTTYDIPDNYIVNIRINLEETDTGTHSWNLDTSLTNSDNKPPVISDTNVEPKYLSAGEPIKLKTTIVDGSAVTGASMIVIDKDNESTPVFASVPLYDDGLHDDEYENDGIYGGTWATSLLPYNYCINIFVNDVHSNQTTYENVTQFTTMPFNAVNGILLVDDTQDEPDAIDIYKTDLTAISKSFDLWDVSVKGELPSQVASQYLNGIIIYVIGKTSGNYHLSSSEQDTIIDYLSSGGNLFITGQRLSYYLTIHGQETNTLLKDYLCAGFIFKDTNCIKINGVSGSVLSDGLSFNLNDQPYTGEIDPINNASKILVYDTLNGGGKTYSSGSAAVLKETELYRSIFFDFDFAGLENDTDRQSFLITIINYLSSPKITDITVLPIILNPEQQITVSAKVTDLDGVQAVACDIKDSSETVIDTITLYDDGTHGDTTAGDSIYTNIWTTSAITQDYYALINAADLLGNSSSAAEEIFFSTISQPNLAVTNVYPKNVDHFAPGELTYFDISILNNGTSATSELSAKMKITGSYIDYYSSSERTVDSISSGQTYTTENGKFYIKISSLAPHGHNINLEFTFTDTSDKTYKDNITITVEDTSPPVVAFFNIEPKNLLPGDNLDIQTKLIDGVDVSEISVHIFTEGLEQEWILPLYDDGLHNDESAGDLIFGNSFSTLPVPYSYIVDLSISDSLNNSDTLYSIDCFTTIPFQAENKILIVDDTLDVYNSVSWFEDYFHNKKIPFDLWKTKQRGEITDLSQYNNGAVIWYSSKSTTQSFTVSEINTITNYLDAGGNLFFTGEKTAYNIASVHGTSFLRDYFFLSYLNQDITINDLNGVASDILTDGFNISLASEQITGEISVHSPGIPIFYYDQTNGSGNVLGYGIAGMRVDTGTYKLVFLDFSWDGINSGPSRYLFLERVLNWFGIDQTPFIESVTISPSFIEVNEPVLIEAKTENSGLIQSIYADIQTPDESNAAHLFLFDDGTHGDVTAGDNIFSKNFLTLPSEKNYFVDLSLKLTDDTELHYNNTNKFTTSSAPMLIYSDYTISYGGNLQPGSSTNISLGLRNVGHSAAANVQCTVELRDSYVNYYKTTPVQFGTIPAGIEKFDSSNSFYVSLDDLCPDSYEITGHLIITDSSGKETTERFSIVTSDTKGPNISDISVSKLANNPGDLVSVSAKLIDGSGIALAKALIKDNLDNLIDEVILDYDNENDVYAGDWTIPATPRHYKVFIYAKDNLNNESNSTDGSVWFTSVAFTKNNPILLVIPQGDEPETHEYRTSLQLLGYGFDVWDKGLRGELNQSAVSLYNEETIIFANDYTPNASFTAGEQQLLVNHLDNDGSLILSGGALTSTLTSYGASANTLINDYFHADYISSVMYIEQLQGVAGSFLDNDSYLVEGYYAGEIFISSPAEPILQVDASIAPDEVDQDGYIASVIDNATEGYKAGLYNFKFADIQFIDKRTDLLNKTLLWINDNDTGAKITSFSVTPLISTPSSTFNFQGTIENSSGILSAQLIIKDKNAITVDTIAMFDDGLHNDGSAGDNIYGSQWTSPSAQNYFSADLQCQTVSGKESLFPEILHFSTEAVPWLFFDHYNITNGSQFITGTTNYFNIYMINNGSALGYDVKAKISTDNPYVSYLYNTTFTYGTMAVGAAKKETGSKYAFRTTTDCPDGTQITLYLDICENSSPVFHQQFTVTVHDTSRPDISGISISPDSPEPEENAVISATVKDGTGIQWVKAYIENFSGQIIQTVNLFDDGFHYDQGIKDGIFAHSVTIPAVPDDYKIKFYAIDTLGNSGYYYNEIWFSTKNFTKNNQVLIIDLHTQDPSEKTPLETSLIQSGIGYDIWKEAVRGSIDPATFNSYTDAIVIFDTKTSYSSTFSSYVQGNIRNYLDEGGHFLLMGEKNVSYLSNSGKNQNELLDEYLKILFIQQPAVQRNIIGISGNPISNGLDIEFNSARAGEIDPIDNAAAVFTLNPIEDNLSSGTSAIMIDNSVYEAVVFDFSFDIMPYENQKNELITKTLNWFTAETAPRLLSCTATPKSLLSGQTITITAQVTDSAGVSSVEIKILDNEGVLYSTRPLYDDATHGDTTAGDSIYANTYIPLQSNKLFFIDLTAESSSGATSFFEKCAEFYTYTLPLYSFISYTLQSYSHIEPGAFVYYGITLQNSGTAPASNVSATVNISDPYLLYNSTIPVDYGAMAVGETKASASNKFRVQASYDCPDNHQFKAYLTLTDDSGNESVSTYYLPVTDTKAPYPQNVTVSEAFVNGGDNVVISTEILEGSGVAEIKAVISGINDSYEFNLQLYDDGTHNDGEPNDNIFANIFTAPYTPRTYEIDLYTKDSLNNFQTYSTDQLFSSIKFTPQHRILLIDDDGGTSNVENSYFSMLDSLGYLYDYWDCALRGDPDISVLNEYITGCVVLFTGINTSTSRISATDQSNYIQYLNSGGNMFVAGSNNAYVLTNYGNSQNTFLNDYLHAQYQTHSYSLNAIAGSAGEWISESFSSTLSFSSAGESDPVPPATPILEYTGSALPYTISSATAGIKTDNSTFKTIFFDFKFHSITNSTAKNQLFDRSLQWLLGPQITSPDISARWVAPANPVDISCSVNDSYPISAVYIKVKDSSSTVVSTLLLHDDATGGDITAGDGTFTATYTAPAQIEKFLIDIYAENINNNYSRLNNALSFSTDNVPYLVFNQITLNEGTAFESGKKNYFDISITNEGNTTSNPTFVSISAQSPYIADYQKTAQPYGNISANATQSKNATAFFIQPNAGTSNNQIINLKIIMNAYYNSTLYSYEQSVPLEIKDHSAPQITTGYVEPMNAQTSSLITICVNITEGTAINTIEAQIRSNDGAVYDTITLFDDGLHLDNQDDDYIFADTWTTPATPDNFVINITTSDSIGNISVFENQLAFTTIGFSSNENILLINADIKDKTAFDIYQNIFQANSFNFDKWNTFFRGFPNESTLNQYQYGAVVLITGKTGITYFSENDYSAIQDYLNNGGNIFMSGESITIHTENDDQANHFLNRYFYAFSVQESARCTVLNSHPNNKTGLSARITIQPGTSAGESDIVSPAEPLFSYDTSAGGGQTLSEGIGGFTVTTDLYHAVCLDFGLETITDNDSRNNLASNIISWLMDWDNDGLKDYWEISYFGSREFSSGTDDPDCDGLTNAEEESFNTNPTVYDTDNDGHNDRWEYIAGTDPRDPLSKFKITNFYLSPSGAHITFSSVPGKSYNIYYKDFLTAPYTGYELIGTYEADSEESTFIDHGDPPARPIPTDKNYGFFIIYIDENN